MKNFVLRLTFVLATLNVLSGIFVAQLSAAVGVRIPDVHEVRWVLILGMPILLFVTYAWLVKTPAEDIFTLVLQAAGLITAFVAPYYWVVLHHAS